MTMVMVITIVILTRLNSSVEVAFINLFFSRVDCPLFIELLKVVWTREPFTSHSPVYLSVN